MSSSHNPLKQFFRQPSIYLRLPSQGQHWPPGSLDMPQNGELPVYPMTAIDEITYRTPDALFNGQAVVSVIQSCVPAIRNAWHIPSVDLNALLVAVRIASYGHAMELASTCPSCAHQSDYDLDLRVFLDNMRTPDFDQHIDYGDLQIYFRPVDYQQQNQTSMSQFEQQKLMSIIPNSELSDEEKMNKLNQALREITEITIAVIATSISVIRAPNAAVTDTDQIEEFLRNCDRKVYNQIRDHVVGLNEQTQLPPLKVQCPECQHDYEQPINMDMSSFFDSAS